VYLEEIYKKQLKFFARYLISNALLHSKLFVFICRVGDRRQLSNIITKWILKNTKIYYMDKVNNVHKSCSIFPKFLLFHY